MIETYQNIPVYHVGSNGSYSQINAERLFATTRGIEFVPQRTFDDIADALAENSRALAVLPIENNSSGRVHEVSDILFERRLIVVGANWLRIPMHLIGVEGASEETAQIVVSQNQALKQSKIYIDSMDLKRKRYDSTSEAAQFVAAENDPRVVCLGGLTLAREAGLQVIREHVANKGENNKTKFYVVRGRQGDEVPEIPKPNGDDLMVTMVVGLKDRKGSLGHFLVELEDSDLRTTVSNPDPEDDGSHPDEGDHLFWIDFQAASLDVRRLLEIARNRSHTFDLLGVYKLGEDQFAE
ncbi:hypothetical protein HYW35_03505 [Candidatus Saccharibacteria bacterium]|nr:hypothetical protein [Candidatus Saccharibacteria bacterium]